MGFSKRFPRWTTAALGIAQLVLTAAIIGLEVWSAYIDLAHGTIWIGFWAGLIFIKTFLMMFCITCCCHGRCYAIYLLCFNLLSAALAGAIIYFDQLFINDICKCFLGDQLCCTVRGIPSLKENYTAVFEDCGRAVLQGTIGNRTCPSAPYQKLDIIKAQLGCAAGMAATCVLYVILCLYACCCVCFGHN